MLIFINTSSIFDTYSLCKSLIASFKPINLLELNANLVIRFLNNPIFSLIFQVHLN